MPEVVESLGLDQQQVIRARTLWMVELLKGGQTLQEVGDKAGVSRERVRQLVKKAGVGSIRKLRSAEIAVRSEAEAMLRSSLHADIVAHPGTTVGGIANFLGPGHDFLIGGCFLQQQRLAHQNGKRVVQFMRHTRQ